ncbi:MAG: FliI/YscN family ATPase [Planctomycetota bacterium]|nr:MAG: FliI/YscN family ATPase [Planctomycetota bacterium]
MRWDLRDVRAQLARTELTRSEGRIACVRGLTLEATGLSLPVGTLCEVTTREGTFPAEVVGFGDGRLRLLPLARLGPVAEGDRVERKAEELRAPAGVELLGRILDGLGRPIDGRGPLLCASTTPLRREAPSPLSRPLIDRPLSTGIRAIDAFTTIGCGQRVGIFAGSGVGKSTLLGQIVRNSSADVAVVALIGERGREVREFVEHILGDEGRRKSVVVAATSDAPSLQRLKGAQLAVAIAEWFRDQGRDVLLVMDSVTRYAFALREVGLAAGEPPTTRGYPPSLYTELPRLVERLGTSARGSITGLLTVLVEGDDMQEPVADTVRSLLDGHIVLRRELAEAAHYPAMDVLASVSRTFSLLAQDRHREVVGEARRLLSAYESSRDLIEVGAYRAGTNPLLDRAIACVEPLRSFLQQAAGQPRSIDDTVHALADALRAGSSA